MCASETREMRRLIDERQTRLHKEPEAGAAGTYRLALQMHVLHIFSVGTGRGGAKKIALVSVNPTGTAQIFSKFVKI